MSDTELLDRRISAVDREVEGEKLVTRHILEYTRRNFDDLASLRTKVKGLRRDVDGLRQDVDGIRSDLSGLRRDLPKIVAKTLREVLDERGH